MIDLNAIRQQADAATEGPWIVMPPETGPDGQGVYHAESLGPICEVGDPYPRGDNHPQENMEFIAAARENVPALLDHIALIASEIEGLMDSLDDHVIADDGEREEVYNAMRAVHQIALGVEE